MNKQIELIWNLKQGDENTVQIVNNPVVNGLQYDILKKFKEYYGYDLLEGVLGMEITIKVK